MKGLQPAFTVVECVMAIGALAILAGLSLPVFTATLENRQLGGGVRQIVSDLRHSQSLAVTNGACYGLRLGSDPQVNRPNQYRIEKVGCDGIIPPWPAATDTTVTNAKVITDWFDIGHEFRGVSLNSIRDNASVTVNSVIFNSRGASVNPFVGSLTHPITITFSHTTGGVRNIQVKSTGSVKAL